MALHSDFDDENDSAFSNLSNEDDVDLVYDSSDSESDGENLSAEDKKSWNLITSMNEEEAHHAKRTDKKLKNLRRSMYKDISIKVESDIYELDRVKLALKSDYFEKLFTGDFDQKETQYLEIQTIDSDTFSFIVDIIYGRELKSILNIENFVSLLLAMDYLQMEIDLRIFNDFITKNLKVRLSHVPDMCKLLIAIEGNPNFTCLLPTVYQYFSIHLIEALKCEEFLSLRFDQFVKIINRNRFPRYSKEKRKIARICTEWICVDINNRLPHMTALVNAAKFRYNFDFRIDERSMNAKFLLEIDDQMKQKMEMERYFNNLLYQNGQIDPGEQENIPNPVQLFSIINKIEPLVKWTSFMEHDLLYDITVQVDNKNYKLHRCKLKSKAGYFTEKVPDDKEAPLKPLNKDEPHQLNGIDQMTFETIIDYIYHDIIDFDTNVSIINLLKACDFLKIDDLTIKCQVYITDNLNSTRIYDEFIEILNFSVGKEHLKDLCVHLRDHIVSTWPKIGTSPGFGSLSQAIFKSILKLEKLEINHVDEILHFCSKWIAHDAQNRYHLLPQIANVIIRNYMINYANFDLEFPTDWTNCSEEFIREKLWQMLSSIRSIILVDGTNSLESSPQPMFIGIESRNLFTILDLDFNEIAAVHSLKVACNEDLSATLIGSNLFLLYEINKKYHFQTYSLSTKKLYSLATFHRLMSYEYLDTEPTLLNCRDEIYCCYEDGTVLKYSIEINRWIVFSKKMPDRRTVEFTSNKNTLFRLSKETQTKRYIAESYDFEQNSWIQLPQFSSRQNKWYFSKSSRIYLTTFQDSLAILLESEESDIALFDPESQTWRDFEISFPNLTIHSGEIGSSIFIQHDGKILCMRDRKIWSISPSNGETTSNHKTVPIEYFAIVAIHSV